MFTGTLEFVFLDAGGQWTKKIDILSQLSGPGTLFCRSAAGNVKVT